MTGLWRDRAPTSGRSRVQAAIAWCPLMATGIGLRPTLAQAPLPTPPGPAPAGPSPQAAPSYPAAELERIVSPIALYPDPLLAQVLAAATFAADIPDAARWADEHHYLTGDPRDHDSSIAR